MNFWSYIKLKQRMKGGLTFEKIEVEVEVDSVSPFGNKNLNFDRSQLKYFTFLSSKNQKTLRRTLKYLFLSSRCVCTWMH